MRKMYSLRFTITLMLFASALTLVLTLSYLSVPVSSGNEIRDAAREYIALLEKIDECFIGSYDIGSINDAALRSAVAALGDRWSYYMTPEEYSSFQTGSRNQFAGIGVGVVIDSNTGGMAVLYTYRNSPAENAGVLAGDVIIGIDGKDITGLSLSEMREILARPYGETAEIDIIRIDGSLETILVKYDLVFSDPIKYDLLDDKIGYISIANFEGGSADGFIRAVDHLLQQDARAIIFDVRNNGGGRVVEMTRMLDYLLPEGEIFISVDKHGKYETTVSDPEMIDIPSVVIVDRYSFSAAEYFAAILKEFDYAEIVGEQTSGKSRSQSTIILPSGSALHISTGQYFTKNKVALFDVGGLTPDHLISLTAEEYMLFVSGNLKKEDDPQIQYAISIFEN